MRTHRLMTAALAAAMILGPIGASAQDPVHVESTADPDAQELPPADAGFIDRMRAKGEQIADETQIVERLNGEIDGWYPRLGGMTRGSGFAIGPGYRFHVTDDGIFVDVSAGISLKGYKAVDANVRWIQAFDDRFELWTDYRYEDFPQEDFFGTGINSALDARTSYDFDSVDLSMRGVFRPVPAVRLGTRVGYMSPDIGSGTDRKFPSIEALFTDVDAPGLTDQPDFL